MTAEEIHLQSVTTQRYVRARIPKLAQESVFGVRT